MAVIGVSLNEVLRDFIGQFRYTYEKYIGNIDLKEGDVTNFNLIEFFNFNTVNDLNTFLYSEASLEIFGHADLMSDGLMNHFNNFMMDIKDFTEHKIVIVGKEANKSIPSTFFFLSKTGCRANNISFSINSIDEWDNVDFLITANPDALQNKPSGKVSIKINASYNKEIKADYELDSILDLIKDENLRNKILNTKITNYEEI